MKKAYMKPEIMFESFASSTNIAGDCRVIINTPTEDYCALVVDVLSDSWHIFMSSYSFCKTHENNNPGVVNDVYNGICYHNPENSNLFNS